MSTSAFFALSHLLTDETQSRRNLRCNHRHRDEYNAIDSVHSDTHQRLAELKLARWIGGQWELTTPDEAIELQKANVDVIAASGFEAGGHRGSFLRASEESLTGTFSLVPQVADLVSVPVVAAGDIADARGIVAAFILGAEGVQIGTVFLACEESGASAPHREALLSGKTDRTALTRGFTGRLGRGIKNQLLDMMNAPGVEILPYPLQRFLMRNISGPAEKSGRPELIPMWAGQSANLAHHTSATELLDKLVSGVSAMIDDFAAKD